MKVRLRWFGLTLIGATLAAPPAHAQFVPGAPDASGARVHAGPLYLNPSLSLTNVGVDTNLFNDPDAVQPKRDLAVTFVPQTDAFIRMGRTWLTGNLRQDLVWFRDYHDQRSVNGTYRGGWLLPLNRLSVHLEGTYVRSRERPSPEIDVRAERRERGGTLVAEVRALSRTFIGTRLDRREVRFADQALFGGEHLSDQLNRTRTSALLSIRHELTPLTSLAFEASQFRDDFTIAHDRDAHASQYAAGFRFDPSAILSGHALVGYRRFSPGDPFVPEYRGPTMSASLGYVARSSTRVTVDAGRDVERLQRQRGALRLAPVPLHDRRAADPKLADATLGDRSQRLIEHQRFKAAAELLHEREQWRAAQWMRPDERVAKIAGDEYEPELEVDLFGLLAAFRGVLERANRRPRMVLPPEQISIEARITQLLGRLSDTEACGFEDLFADGDGSRPFMIVTFLAMLEMIRLKLIRVFQQGGMGAIRVYKRARPTDAPHPIHDPEDEFKAHHTAPEAGQPGPEEEKP